MKNETELQQALYVIERYRAQAESLARQRQMVMLTMEEHMRAKITLCEYEKQGEGREILVPAGANTFLYAKAMRPEKVLIGIGSDVVIEDTAAGAVQKLDDSIKTLEDADKRLTSRINDIENQMAELSAEVEDEMRKASAKPAPKK